MVIDASVLGSGGQCHPRDIDSVSDELDLGDCAAKAPRAEAVRRGSCRAYCWTATRDLQLP